MSILAVQIAQPIHRITFENVASDRTLAFEHLDILKATANALPDGVDALLVTADLQGREKRDGDGVPGCLLGEVVAEEVEVLAELGKLPPLDRIGVILAGDFYARPAMDRRGGSGDVRSVWKAFASRCRWVAGVAGNHDMFGPGWSEPTMRTFKNSPGIHLLDGNIVELDGLRIGGLSGIVGNPRRPLRRPEEEFAEHVGSLAAKAPDILVMHDGPDVEGADFKGWRSIREALEASRPTLVIRGHVHWHNPLATLANGTQVLNVDSRVVILRKGE